MIPFGDRQNRLVKKTYMTATNSDSVSDPYNFVKTAILPPSGNPTMEAIQDSNLVRQQWAKGTSPAQAKKLLGKEFTRGNSLHQDRLSTPKLTLRR
jgi:hypothetical protein